jgi:pSer/pThr/pTyr-binding forkhead associated (FHA) protein
MPHISVLYPEESRQTAQISTSGLLVGRSSSCDLCLTDEFISSRHCKFFFENGFFFVEDLGSTNGTFVNGTEIERKSLLEAGQSIQIGITVMKLDI